MKERFDLLVVGAGPAGIAAAVTAAESGMRVGLVDDNAAAGGQIWRAGGHLPVQAQQWQARLQASPVVRLQGWRVFDCPAPGVLLAEQNGAVAESCAELHAGKLILATGARERFLPFPGWTLPNVMGVGGLDAMARGGLNVAGKRVVVAGTGPLLLAVAAHLAQSGAKVLCVCEQASRTQLARFAARLVFQPAKLLKGVGYRRDIGFAPLLTGCWPTAALGDKALQAVRIRQRGREREIPCDYLACGFHLVPNTELGTLLGCRIADNFVWTDERMQTSVADVYCAGEPTGIGGVDLSLLEGQIAAYAAGQQPEKAQELIRRRQRLRGFVDALAQACALHPDLRALAEKDTIVCRCEDVRHEALANCANWREAKLATRCGMGPCQGRICGPAAEFAFGWRVESVRPPLFPALVGSLAFDSKPAPLNSSSS